MCDVKIWRGGWLNYCYGSGVDDGSDGDFIGNSGFNDCILLVVFVGENLVVVLVG